MQLNSLLTVVTLCFFGSVVFACGMTDWTMPAVARPPVNVQGANMPIPAGIEDYPGAKKKFRA